MATEEKKDSFKKKWLSWSSFRQLPRASRRLVFYSQGAEDWPHLEPLLRGWSQATDGEIFCYVTSHSNDPGLNSNIPGLMCFTIDSTYIRTLFFFFLGCDLLITTMPDLNTSHVLRSPWHAVRYAYVHHSMVSTHMIYRREAFDHYDAILCVGPHHMAEIRRREELFDLPPKELVVHGYGVLDQLLRSAETSPPSRGKVILVAPSWGPHGLIEGGWCDSLVATLLHAGYRVVLRPHPRTRLLSGQALDMLVKRFAEDSSFILDEEITSTSRLVQADLMISDWSGVALEFSFGLLKPVLFIDVPRKVNNPEYEALGLEPIEVALRKAIGMIVAPDDPEQMLTSIASLLNAGRSHEEQLRTLRQRWIYNPGQGAQAGVAWIRHTLAFQETQKEQNVIISTSTVWEIPQLWAMLRHQMTNMPDPMPATENTDVGIFLQAISSSLPTSSQDLPGEMLERLGRKIATGKRLRQRYAPGFTQALDFAPAPDAAYPALVAALLGWAILLHQDRTSADARCGRGLQGLNLAFKIIAEGGKLLRGAPVRDLDLLEQQCALRLEEWLP